MASWYLGINRGQLDQPGLVVTSSSAASSTITTDAVAASASAVSSNTAVALALTKFDTAFTSTANALSTLLGANITYSATTHQFSGTMSTQAVIAVSQGAALIALLNAALTSEIAAQTSAATTATLAATVVTDVGTANSDFQLEINSSKSITKKDAVKAMEVFEQFMLSNYIPAGSPGTNLPPL